MPAVRFAGNRGQERVKKLIFEANRAMRSGKTARSSAIFLLHPCPFLTEVVPLLAHAIAAV